MVVELQGRAHLLDDPVLHDHDPVRHGHGLHLVVGHVDRGGAQLPVEFADLRAHADAQLCVQVGQRFVHEEDFLVLDDGAAQGHPLALAAGEVLGLTQPVFLQAEDIHGPVHLFLDLGGGDFHVL